MLNGFRRQARAFQKWTYIFPVNINLHLYCFYSYIILNSFLCIATLPALVSNFIQPAACTRTVYFNFARYPLSVRIEVPQLITSPVQWQYRRYYICVNLVRPTS